MFVQKTTAHRRYVDDVPRDVKLKRVAAIYAVYRDIADKLHKEQIGEYQLILIEGVRYSLLLGTNVALY